MMSRLDALSHSDLKKCIKVSTVQHDFFRGCSAAVALMESRRSALFFENLNRVRSIDIASHTILLVSVVYPPAFYANY